jgi:hypothetical protein
MTYQKQATSAAAKIAAKGGKVTWVKSLATATDTTVDPNQPWKVTERVANNAPVPPATFPNTPILFTRGKGLAQQLAALTKGTEVAGSGQNGLLPGNVPFTPELSDTVIKADGMVLNITAIDALEPDGTPILYFITFQE